MTQQLISDYLNQTLSSDARIRQEGRNGRSSFNRGLAEQSLRALSVKDADFLGQLVALNTMGAALYLKNHVMKHYDDIPKKEMLLESQK